MAFLTTIFKGGFLILLPLLLFFMLLSEIVDMVIGLATPLADLFPKGLFDDPQYPVALAIVLLLAASFVIGLAMKSSAAIRMGNWVEEKTIGKLPIYRFVKNLVEGLLGAEDKASFKPALIECGEGQREFCYIVEDHGDGELTVLVPWAPAAFAGSVKIVKKSQVKELDEGLGDASLVLNHLGLGACKLIKPTKP